ncbi:hypothetical protein JCM10296v2_003153 [Rhodotorula toruloides]
MSSSALYDAALCSVDFAQLLPGLFNRDNDHQQHAASPPRTTPKWAPRTTPHDHSDSQHQPRTGTGREGLMARRHAHTNKGKHHTTTKASAKTKSNGATRPPPSSSQPAPRPPSTAAGLTAIAPPSPSASSYPQTFYNDDLSTAPLFPPAFKRTDSRPLPPVEDDRDRAHPSPGGSNSPGSSSRDVGRRIHPADRDADERVSWRSAAEEDDDEDEDYSYDSSLSSSLSYSEDEYDEDADEEDSGGGADDEEDLEEEDDDSDERRPFPDPRLAKQKKYMRRSPADEKDDVSPPTHVEHAHPPRLDTNLNLSITAVRSAYATPLDSPLVSPSHVPSHKTSVMPVPSNLPSPTYEYPSHSADQGHYTSLPNSGVERTCVPSAYASPVSDSDSDSESDWRGRNRHPRLLWRSTLDPSSLRILDAHHARVRGGPLPRLVVDEEGRVVLSASGVEREREKAGLEEGEGKERVRRRRGRIEGQGKGRSWSVVGRRWSRAVEKCGL